jgi:4-diphosphocytidyl-2C-methyl-D-erythritol kinase
VGQWLVLLVPQHTLQDKTRQLYAALQPRDFTDGATTRRAAEGLRQRAPLDGDRLVNGFERAARQIFPGLDELWAAAEYLTHQRFCLSGAGPALFGLASSGDEARRMAATLEPLDARGFVVRTVKHARASLRRAAIEYA